MPGQRAACDALVDGDECEVTGFLGAPGVCRDSVCVIAGCGDGFVLGAEDCDGSKLGDFMNCNEVGFQMSAALSCSDQCTYDLSACSGLCGDGELGEGEFCDGADLNGKDCSDFGFYQNAGLACNAACAFDAGACVGLCGDGITDTSDFEGCDDGASNSNLPDATCRVNCQPQRCGDGILDSLSGENCDDGNPLPGDGCSGLCIIEECGNGVVDLIANGAGFVPAEDCDDGINNVNHDGCTAICLDEAAKWLGHLSGSDSNLAGSTPAARLGHAAAYDAARGRVVLFGGNPGDGTVLGDTWEWDGVTWFRRTPASAPPARKDHKMVYDAARARVVLFGGGPANGIGLDDTWEWDGSNWTEIPTSVAPAGRRQHSMAYDASNNRVVLFGGTERTSNNTEIVTHFNDTWLWDGNVWVEVVSQLGQEPQARRNASMAYDPIRQKVVLFGGAPPDFGFMDISSPVKPPPVNRFGDTWEWDGASWLPTSPGTRPPRTEGAGLAFDVSLGQVLLFGGLLGDDAGFANPPVNNETWAWNGSVWTELSPTIAPPGRGNHVMAYDSLRSRMVIFAGGVQQEGASIRDTWELDATSWTDKSLPNTPSGRFSMPMVYDAARALVVLFGGGPAGTGNGTWEWNGTGWTVRTTQAAPERRSGHAMAFDSARGETILFGGFVAGASNADDTWRYDGNDWQALDPAQSPPERRDLAMAYDAARDRVVLFGGRGVGTFGDTWEWDGGKWQERMPSSRPPSRRAHAMVYDPVRAKVVLFGGVVVSGGSAQSVNDLWEWDGIEWIERTPTTGAPSARFSHSLSYDIARSTIIMFGGFDSTGPKNDTWEWDGSSWTEITPFDSPRVRSLHAGVYDPARANHVIFGGLSSNSSTIDTHTFQFTAGVRESCTTGFDGDGDGLVGCEDPDCWAYCTPTCAPTQVASWPADCDISAAPPRCGDGSCNAALENRNLCPADCTIAAEQCGDFLCDPQEQSGGTCPGDCGP